MNERRNIITVEWVEPTFIRHKPDHDYTSYLCIQPDKISLRVVKQCGEELAAEYKPEGNWRCRDIRKDEHGYFITYSDNDEALEWLPKDWERSENNFMNNVVKSINKWYIIRLPQALVYKLLVLISNLKEDSNA